MQTLNIIGAGKAGSALGLVLAGSGVQVRSILSRSSASSERLAGLLGQGHVVDEIADLEPANLTMIATGDDALAAVASSLAESAPFQGDRSVVFHVSGAVSSAVLAPLSGRGAAVASIHPVQTFSSPKADASRFAGTWCGIEGDEAARAVLRPVFERAGARCFDVSSEGKGLYHAAAVIASNYLFALIEASFRCYEAAGLDRKLAAEVVRPILHATVDNALDLGPAQALSGPIARGDHGTIEKHLAALQSVAPPVPELYRVMGALALELSAEKGGAATEDLARIKELLASRKA
ncbi:Rossmann-like and DUF2520 domain-containing protein [Roseibium sp. RKSG952]|uniref:Rossmann-like and DUF2520 domain-containing protein n=1 Tax=Roseibium sp. RKSG952 TaxID=2529384 RepID=UPI0012BD544D|nr:Rossmann-like and DUF2520 domain-containing protein [Roseibium sp. RKSG952]MTH99987.1 DUF2520 domain-containing protein [Roseibium sp. RKSG952]